MEIQGKYNKAKIFTDNVDSETIGQIIQLCNQKAFEGEQIRIMSDCHAGKGCVIGTTMTVSNCIVPNLVGVDIGCLDKDTEILTPTGRIKISDYRGEKILVYDKVTETSFFDIPYAYIKEPCNGFYHFKTSKGLDQMFSREHKMLLWKGYKGKGRNQEIMLAEEFYNKILKMGKPDVYAAKTTFSINNQELPISNEIIRVLVMVSADGTLRKNKDGSTRIELHFKKERKIERAKQLLKNANIDYRETKGVKETTYIYFKDNRVNTKDLTQFYQASKEQLEILTDEIFYWDGSVDEKRNHKYYSTTVKTNADVIQWAFASVGIRAGIYERKDERNEKWAKSYQVYITQNEYVGYNNKIDIVKSIDGYKYCFTTSTGFFVIRRNNCISITGNCGVLGFVIPKDIEIDLQQLDETIRKHIPHGFSIRNNTEMGKRLLWDAYDVYLETIFADIDFDRVYKSVGTLGGGNHFIELDQFENGDKILVVHSGSRHLGLEIATHYQKKAIEYCKEKYDNLKKQEVTRLKASNIDLNNMEQKVKEINVMYRKPKDELCYLEGELMDNYLHDMKIVQKYAEANRMVILYDILSNLLGFLEFQNLLKREDSYFIESVHNYLDMRHMILRKGSISAQEGEKLIIPINMRDGVIIGKGKGNSDWNYSAPHGAGRILSRRDAKEQITIEEFKSSMKDIYSTSVCNSTLDEAPQAYKPIEEIIDNIGDSVEILEIVKPIYNFKSN